MLINNDLLPIIIDDLIAFSRTLGLYAQAWRLAMDYDNQPTITIKMLAPYRLMVTGIDTADMDITPGNVYYLPMGTEVRYRSPDTLLSSYCRDVGLQVARTEMECDSNNDIALTLQLIVTDTAYAVAEDRRAATAVDWLADERDNPVI